MNNAERIETLAGESTRAMMSGDRAALVLAWTKATGMLDLASQWSDEELELIRGEQRALSEALQA